MMKRSFFCLVAVAAVAVTAMPQIDDTVGETELQASMHAETIGKVLQKLPDLIKKTGAWIRDLASIGDEVHPDVGDVIRVGADAVEEASNNVPDDIHTKVQDHLFKLINITRVVQENVNTSLSDLPAFRESVSGLPGDDVLLDVIESIPSADYVDEQINEAINYFEPLAEAIGAQSVA